MSEMPRYDVVVVGGGMAGTSIAAELVRSHSVLLLEGESELAHHTTGRSAAIFLDSIGNAVIRSLTKASRPIMDELATDPDTPPLLHRRGMICVAPADQTDALAELIERVDRVGPLDVADALAACPALRGDYVAAAALEPDACDIDVLAMHQHYLRAGRRGGLRVNTAARVVTGERDGDGWRLETTGGPLRAGAVVDAAGAWADELAAALGSRRLGLTPLRRTAAVSTTVPVDPSWPMVTDAADTFYFRPESGGVLISPADETPSEPCDARPDDIDVALAIERVNAATTLGIRSITSSWAGLRTFAPDRTPVVGYDSAGLFWLAGQGGYGIQTAAALARLAAALVRGEPPPASVTDHGVEVAALSPDRRMPEQAEGAV